MRIATLVDSACSPLRRFGADRDAAVAVEFALILPVMLTLYIGCVSVTEALNIDRKVIQAAYTVADLTARAEKKEVTDADIGEILDAAEAVIVPYSSDRLTVTVTSVEIDADGKAKTLWRATKSKDGTEITDQSVDVTSKIPDALKKSGTGLVWGEVSYNYEPAIGYVISGEINLYERTFMRPRKFIVVEKK